MQCLLGEQSVNKCGFASAGQVSGVRVCRFFKAKEHSNQISSSYIIDLFTGTAALRQIKGGNQAPFIKETGDQWKRSQLQVKVNWPGSCVVPPYRGIADL